MADLNVAPNLVPAQLWRDLLLERLPAGLFADLLEVGGEVVHPEARGLAEFQRHDQYVVHVCRSTRNTWEQSVRLIFASTGYRACSMRPIEAERQEKIRGETISWICLL